MANIISGWNNWICRNSCKLELNEEEKEQAPLTLTDIASVLSDSGLSEEQTAVIEKTYEDTFGEDLPSAEHLVDPKLVEANAKRKEKLDW